MSTPLKKLGKRLYAVVAWTKYEVTLQAVDGSGLIVTMPRRFYGGLKDGS